MEKQPWHENFLLALEELSDPEAQRRSWLHGDETNVPPPSELINQVFDDSGIIDLLDDGPVFSDRADKALRDLSDLVDTSDLNQPIENLLASKHWLQVASLARLALNAVHEALDS